jgi:hypothetical protein
MFRSNMPLLYALSDLIGWIADMMKLVLHDGIDIHAVTGLLKLYFRELSDPLFTDSLYHAFIDAASM